jgi:hypothetical protein
VASKPFFFLVEAQIPDVQFPAHVQFSFRA